MVNTENVLISDLSVNLKIMKSLKFCGINPNLTHLHRKNSSDLRVYSILLSKLQSTLTDYPEYNAFPSFAASTPTLAMDTAKAIPLTTPRFKTLK